MSGLVSVAELKDWLGFTTSDRSQDRNLSRLLSDVIVEFEKACGRAENPFRSAASATAVEIQDGEGVSRLRLNYPIAALAGVVIGLDVSSPEETLDISSVQVLVFRTGSHYLVRTDGDVFPEGVQNVHVDYTTGADLPADAQRAVLEVAGATWERRGSEGAEQVGDSGSTVKYDDPKLRERWVQAVNRNAVLTVA